MAPCKSGSSAGARHATLLVPGSIATRTGGYAYDRRVAAELRARGWTVDVREIPGRFPEPSRADLDRAAAALAGIGDNDVVIVDGLAFGAMPDQLEREARR